MGRSREAIDAAMLATAIGVDRTVEAQIGRFIPGDDAARAVDGDGGGDRRQILVLGEAGRPAIVLAGAVAGLVAPGAIRNRTSPLGRQIGKALRRRSRARAIHWQRRRRAAS